MDQQTLKQVLNFTVNGLGIMFDIVNRTTHLLGLSGYLYFSTKDLLDMRTYGIDLPCHKLLGVHWKAYPPYLDDDICSSLLFFRFWQLTWRTSRRCWMELCSCPELYDRWTLIFCVLCQVNEVNESKAGWKYILVFNCNFSGLNNSFMHHFLIICSKAKRVASAKLNWKSINWKQYETV